MLLIPQNNRDEARLYMRAVGYLLECELLRERHLMGSRVVVFSDLTKGRLASVENLPNSDALRGLVSRIRVFLLNDKTGFQRNRNTAHAAVASRANARHVGAYLAALKEEWRQCNQLRDSSPRFAISDLVKSGECHVVTPAIALDAWLYGEIFHAENADLVATWDAIRRIPPLYDYHRAFALSAMVDYVQVIIKLALVLRCLLDGKLPTPAHLEGFHARWQQIAGVRVPSREHFLQHLGSGPPMSRAMALRLLQGENISFDAIVKDGFGKPAASAAALRPGDSGPA